MIIIPRLRIQILAAHNCRLKSKVRIMAQRAPVCVLNCAEDVGEGEAVISSFLQTYQEVGSEGT